MRMQYVPQQWAPQAQQHFQPAAYVPQRQPAQGAGRSRPLSALSEVFIPNTQEEVLNTERTMQHLDTPKGAQSSGKPEKL